MTNPADVITGPELNAEFTGSASPPPAGRERSIGELLKELRDESGVLLRQEVALAKTELSEKAAKAGRNAAYIAAGGAVAYIGVVFLLLAVTVILYLILKALGAETHGMWIAPLIVGLVVAGVGYVLIQKGISTFKNESLVPEKTAQSLKEDKQWLQDKATQ
ncbi:MAG TPA: phage holin family protein [Tepidisphaeraceae bacterium]|jgi:hypothetical protein